jgi:hypothetical protein
VGDSHMMNKSVRWSPIVLFVGVHNHTLYFSLIWPFFCIPLILSLYA